MTMARRLVLLWCVFFLATALSAAAIQLVLLPRIPAWHAGEGLLATSYDAITYHNIAVDLAAKIRAQGWGAWELRPFRHASAGIAAAVYALTVPKPWTLIPLNAAVHATSALLLVLLFRLFVPTTRRAVACALPFFIFPSAALWYAQLLKDGYCFLGAFALTYGSALVFSGVRGERVRCASGELLTIAGSYLIWVAREDTALVCLGGMLAFTAMAGCLRRSVAAAVHALLLAILLGLFACINSLNATHYRTCPGTTKIGQEIKAEPVSHYDELLRLEAWRKEREAARAAAAHLTTPAARRSSGVPLLDSFVALVGGKRDGFISTGGSSSVDTQVRFMNVRDIVAYVPRALQLALCAPFPSQWFRQGSSETTTVMRRVSAFEMSLTYLALFFLPAACWFWRRRSAWWCALFFNAGMLLFYGLIVTNVGSLYRMRYGFLMVLVGMGIAGALEAQRRLRCAGSRG